MQRLAGLFIGLLVLIDAFFIAYAVGINVRKNVIVDPTLPVQVKKVEMSNPSPAPVPTKSTESAPAATKGETGSKTEEQTPSTK